MSRPLIAVAAFLFGAAALRADDWRSRDGYIAAAEPDPARFTKAPEARPDVVEWVSLDGKVRITILEVPSPQNWRRDRASIDGLLFDNSWTIVESRDISIGGLSVPRAMGKTVEKGTPKTSVRLYLVADRKDYYVFVDCAESDAATHPDASAFLDSIRLLGTPFIRPTPSSPPPVEPEWNVARISQLMGGLGCFLLVVAGAAWLVVRSLRSQKRNRSRRRDEDDEE